jgi:hypothetical protein
MGAAAAPSCSCSCWQACGVGWWGMWSHGGDIGRPSSRAWKGEGFLPDHRHAALTGPLLLPPLCASAAVDTLLPAAAEPLLLLLLLVHRLC